MSAQTGKVNIHSNSSDFALAKTSLMDHQRFLHIEKENHANTCVQRQHIYNSLTAHTDL